VRIVLGFLQNPEMDMNERAKIHEAVKTGLTSLIAASLIQMDGWNMADECETE